MKVVACICVSYESVFQRHTSQFAQALKSILRKFSAHALFQLRIDEVLTIVII